MPVCLGTRFLPGALPEAQPHPGQSGRFPSVKENFCVKCHKKRWPCPLFFSSREMCTPPRTQGLPLAGGGLGPARAEP